MESVSRAVDVVTAPRPPPTSSCSRSAKPVSRQRRRRKVNIEGREKRGREREKGNEEGRKERGRRFLVLSTSFAMRHAASIRPRPMVQSIVVQQKYTFQPYHGRRTDAKDMIMGVQLHWKPQKITAYEVQLAKNRQYQNAESIDY